MRRKVPRSVHIHANWSKICTDHRHVVHLPEMPGVEIFFHLAYAGVVHEDVADHQDQLLARGKLEKSEPLLHFGRQRFFYKHMLAMLKSLLRQREVSARRSGDDDSIDRWIRERARRFL